METKKQYPTLRGKRILVVDDSDQIRSLLEEVFTMEGATVTTAAGGQEAMGLARFSDFDLVLLDLIMPRPNGMDVLHFLQNAKPELLECTLLLTGDRYDTSQAGLETGLDIPAVYKPFEITHLRDEACRLLESASAGAA
jgi:DNA-binding response OmpR family regulator